MSFRADTVSHEDKRMRLRGNNVHFARATVFHELVPGHHLQGFMTARFSAHRRAFSTPFWGEGWALCREMLLWDRGFRRSPEDRVGMLFFGPSGTLIVDRAGVDTPKTRREGLSPLGGVLTAAAARPILCSGYRVRRAKPTPRTTSTCPRGTPKP